MRRPRFLPAGALVLTLALLAAGPAVAARFTPSFDALEAVLSARVEDATQPKSAVKRYRKALRTLGRDTSSLAADVKTARKILPGIDAKAGADAPLHAAVESAVADLTTRTGAYLDEVTADAVLLGKKPAPGVQARKLLGGAATKFRIAVAPGPLAARLRALFAVVTLTGRAARVVQTAGGGGGGGGGGGAACGPTDFTRPQGLRTLASGESFGGDVNEFGAGGPHAYTFAAGSIALHAGPQSGYQGTVASFTAYDCAERSSIAFVVPAYPPVVNQTYVNVLFTYQADWDEAMEASKGTVTFTSFDAATGDATGTFVGAGTSSGSFTVRGLK